MMMFINCSPYKQGCKHRKYKRLQKCNQKL